MGPSPQLGFFLAIVTMRACKFLGSGRRQADLDLHRQNSRKSARCQRTNVSGLAMARASRQGKIGADSSFYRTRDEEKRRRWWRRPTWMGCFHAERQENHLARGTMFGYDSFIGFVPKARVGIVVLPNARTIAGGGRHDMRPQQALASEVGSKNRNSEVTRRFSGRPRTFFRRRYGEFL